MLKCNKCVRCVKETKDFGLTYMTGVHWPSRTGEKVEMCIATVSDASHGNEFSSITTIGSSVSRSDHKEQTSFCYRTRMQSSRTKYDAI